MTNEMNAAQKLKALYPQHKPRIAVVLGSGWGGLTGHVVDPVRVPYAELPGFPEATVQGHGGELWLGRIGQTEVAVMSGRKHAYEDGVVDGMRLPLETLRDIGCEAIVLTNAAGSLRPAMEPCSLMLINDYINATQRSPLVGEMGSERFVDMKDAYDPALRRVAHEVARESGTRLHEGVYLWSFGPQFETPAEIRMFERMGADAVGMSTVPETILARRMGLPVLAFSLITNMAAGLSGESLSHSHTLSQARAAGDTASGLLARIIANL
ncbi:purine-nucleoside phosphorylase [Uliginosibacterium sp. IMCC34675]|uniref:Purine nucleoside phosphorylase n=2 Tax=Uliginosibacterium aquaticum TaxID=2731212 RepID=A0ABX2IHV6_9RHOO|nr:purine-nucleoside phosphorylase [Uliginosibacterium aquaticum]